jgi:hypothetical protein
MSAPERSLKRTVKKITLQTLGAWGIHHQSISVVYLMDRRISGAAAQ